MTLVITHVLPETGSEFHEQKLYHVPRETARQITSDFEELKEKRSDKEKRSGKEERRDKNARAPATNTYDYPLGIPDPTEAPEPAENDEAEDTSPLASAEGDEPQDLKEGRGEQPRGILSIDFRTVTAIQAYDRLS
ncbi:hypothetical protein [Salinibacter altiplanensis]|uniref:hypothetical protein n=1 Tax=Salinibacter altiplanensis TaxID=1803181 RepID=UPI000C9FDFE6|nr:hypothetical protein [Salinibacter altiplanensis]